MQVSLKQARQLRGYTQVELARLAGVSEQTIVRYEKDEQDMKVSMAILIAKLLDVTFDGLRFAVSTSDEVQQ